MSQECSQSWCTLVHVQGVGNVCAEVEACVPCAPEETEEHCQHRAEEEAEELRAGPMPANCTGC